MFHKVVKSFQGCPIHTSSRYYNLFSIILSVYHMLSLARIQSPPKLLEKRGQLFFFYCTLTLGLTLKDDYETRSVCQHLFRGIHIQGCKKNLWDSIFCLNPSILVSKQNYWNRCFLLPRCVLPTLIIQTIILPNVYSEFRLWNFAFADCIYS